VYILPRSLRGGVGDNVLLHVSKAVCIYLAPSTSMLLIDRAQDHGNLQARVYPVCYLINSVSTWLVAAFKARDALLTADLQSLQHLFGHTHLCVTLRAYQRNIPSPRWFYIDTARSRSSSSLCQRQRRSRCRATRGCAHMGFALKGLHSYW